MAQMEVPSEKQWPEEANGYSKAEAMQGHNLRTTKNRTAQELEDRCIKWDDNIEWSLPSTLFLRGTGRSWSVKKVWIHSTSLTPFDSMGFADDRDSVLCWAADAHYWCT